MENTKLIPAALMAAIKGDINPGRWADVVGLIQDAHEDGRCGRESYPSTFDEGCAIWCKENGGTIYAITREEAWAIQALMSWKAAAWKQGCEDARKAVEA